MHHPGSVNCYVVPPALAQEGELLNKLAVTLITFTAPLSALECVNCKHVHALKCFCELDCVWLENVFTDRLLRVKARRAPSPPHAWLCPYPRSVFSCRPSHCTIPQICGCLGPPTSEGRLAVTTVKYTHKKERRKLDKATRTPFFKIFKKSFLPSFA